VGPENTAKQKTRKLVWKTRLPASSDLIETKRKNKKEKIVFKTIQKLNNIPENLESIPSMVTNSVVGKISLWTRK
jgi:hypothetical protein